MLYPPTQNIWVQNECLLKCPAGQLPALRLSQIIASSTKHHFWKGRKIVANLPSCATCTWERPGAIPPPKDLLCPVLWHFRRSWNLNYANSVSHKHIFFLFQLVLFQAGRKIIPNPTTGHQFILVGEGKRANSKVLYPYPMSNLMGKSKQEMLKHWLNSKFWVSAVIAASGKQTREPTHGTLEETHTAGRERRVHKPSGVNTLQIVPDSVLEVSVLKNINKMHKWRKLIHFG